MSDRRRRWLSLLALSATCLVAAGGALASSASTARAAAADPGSRAPSTLTPVAALAAPAGEPAMASAPDDAEGRVKIVATIQALDTGAQKIWLVTGMGLALRVVQAEVAPSCQIKVSGETARLGDLKPGTVVRAECLSSGGKLVAVVIETVQIPVEGREQ